MIFDNIYGRTPEMLTAAKPKSAAVYEISICPAHRQLTESFVTQTQTKLREE
jgi:hypothetical protein